MSIKHISTCDGPDCDVSVEVDRALNEGIWGIAQYCGHPASWLYFDGQSFHDYACIADYARTKALAKSTDETA